MNKIGDKSHIFGIKLQKIDKNGRGRQTDLWCLNKMRRVIETGRSP
jgi:hypothetical protein